MSRNTTWTTTFVSPVGELTLVAIDDALAEVAFPGEPRPSGADDHPILRQAADELTAYFAGERTRFDVPLAPRGTPFQERVWAVLSTIPYGETWSYADVARAIGQPKAVRAVGAANGRNPIAVLVPCHRVIGSSGALTGYGGGMARKRWLLDHEQHLLPLASSR